MSCAHARAGHHYHGGGLRQLPCRFLESENPTAIAGIAHAQKGMVSRQHGHGKKKEPAGQGGRWEPGKQASRRWETSSARRLSGSKPEGGEESGNPGWEGGPARIYTLVGL